MSAGPVLPRRLALALGAAGLVAVAGCDDGPQTPDPTPTPTPDADAALVEEVVAQITAVWGLTAGRPALAAVHRTHVEALDAELTGRRRRLETGVLRKREEALRVDLVNAAMAAESGELARLLASMSAAVAQQLVVL